MGERISFNINAELHENSHGDLAVRFPGDHVYQNVGTEKGARFQNDSIEMIEHDRHPARWTEMPVRELEHRDWHCVAMLGFLEGDVSRPAVELEIEPEQIGPQAKAYLSDALKAR